MKMFNVEFKHSGTGVWTAKASFEGSKEAEQFAYQQSVKYLNEYRVVVADSGFVVADGYKSKF